MTFSVKNRNSVFSCTASYFLRYFLFSDVVRHILLKNIHVRGLELLNFVCMVVFNIETALQNAILAILE